MKEGGARWLLVDTNLQTRGRSPVITNGKNVTKEKKMKTKSAGKAARWVSDN
jgi:hypothetical protein